MATTLRLSDSLKARADAYAEKTGVSVAALVSIALADYLDARERANTPSQARSQVPEPPGAAPSAEKPVMAVRGVPVSRQQRRALERRKP